MRNGIRGKDADIYISNNHFRHIRHNIGTQSSNEGIAIESHNDILCQLSVDGTIISANAPDDWTMNDCRIGVSLIKAHLSCTATRMRTMTRGIEITQCQYAKIKIVENYMECRQMGVFTYNSMPFEYFDAVRNEIIVNNPNTIGVLAAFGGVVVQGSGTNIESASNGNFNIIDNDITLENARYGILVSSCLGGRITDNSIMFNQLTPIRGIMLRQVNKFNLNCNVVNGIGQDELNNILGSVYLPAAYEFVNSKSIYFNCNSSNRIYTGLAVFNNCSGSRYKANLFYRHKYGLYYGTGANSSPQSLHGNIFDIDTLTGSRFGAFGISNNPAFYNNINHYTVNPITNPFCNPMRIGRNNGAQIFSANQSGYWQNNGWFEQDPFGTNYECAFDSINCSDDIYRYRDMPDSLFNTNFTINPADSTIYEWDAARYLTEKILSDSTLLQDSLFSTYYNSLSGTSVIQFSEISRHIGRAYVLSSTDSASLTTLNTAYTITYTTYRQTDSLIRATGASGTLQTQRDSLRNVLRTYRFGLTQLHQQIDSARSMRLDSIEQINNQLQAGTVQSLNEQTLNQLRIRLNNKKAFTQAEQTLLYFIAMQCPYSGGASVYTARALYAVVNDTLDFMDHVLCGNEDWFFRKEETGANATTSVILYPNPAHHIINIAGLVADEENKVEIFNNMGIRISEAICTLSNLALDVSNYPNGVYIIKLSNSSLTESFKITINR
jgi:hypothetical protein